MAQDRWNEDRYGDEPFRGDDRRGDERRPERPRTQAQQDWRPEDYDRYRDDRPRQSRNWAQGWAVDDDARYRPFGDSGPGSRGGRYDDLSPGHRAFEAQQQRIHRGQYDADRYRPNPREGRGDEPRSWWDRTQDELSSWFGDGDARRRREWDEQRADSQAEHRGRGPKGYKRSDSRIEEDINDRLTDDRYLDASDVQVTVKDSEVTLSGTVLRREDKRRAEDLAENISGVGHVQNNLRVKPRADDIPTTGDVLL